MKIIEFDRRKAMTKKAWKAIQAEKRKINGFNTGTRNMKSTKDYNRQASKKEVRNYEVL